MATSEIFASHRLQISQGFAHDRDLLIPMLLTCRVAPRLMGTRMQNKLLPTITLSSGLGQARVYHASKRFQKLFTSRCDPTLLPHGKR